MNKSLINAVHDDELLALIEKLGLKERFEKGLIKCKFTGSVITFDNLYSIFPESGDIKFVCDSPDAIRQFISYMNERNL